MAESTKLITAEDLPKGLDVVSRFPRSDGDELLIGAQRFRGRDYAVARVYYRDDKGMLKPTRKGINVDEELLPEIIKGLQAVDDLLTERAGG